MTAAPATPAPSREALLDAAERLLARHGYRGLTIEEVAREAGLSRRTVYVHFPSHDAVVLGTIDRVVDRVLARLEALAGSDAPAPERLRAMLRERVAVRLQSVSAYAHALDGLFAALRPAYLERRRGYLEAELKVLARVVREGQRAGSLAPGRAPDVAALLLTATNAFLPHGLSPAQLEDTPHTLAQLGALTDLLVRGLTADAPARPARS